MRQLTTTTRKKIYTLHSEGFVLYKGGTCTLEVPRDFGPFYRYLIPRYMGAHPNKYPPHITIVREWERHNEEFLNRPYEGYIFSFEYSGKIHFDGTYFYLKCRSQMIKQMREEFGLIPYRKDNCYHLTVGNNKENNARI